MFLPLILAADLATASPSQRVPPSGRDAGLEAIKLCMSQASLELDDGISDAKTIAEAVGPTCLRQVQPWYDAQLAKDGGGPSTSVDATDMSRKLALVSVLRMRAANKAGPKRRAN